MPNTNIGDAYRPACGTCCTVSKMAIRCRHSKNSGRTCRRSTTHDVHRRAPIQCFLVLVLVNLTWAFQFSGTKIDDRARRPNSRCLHPAGALDRAVCTASTHKPGKKPQPRWAPVVWRDLFLASTLGIIPAQFGLAWGVAHSRPRAFFSVIPPRNATERKGSCQTTADWLNNDAVLCARCWPVLG